MPDDVCATCRLVSRGRDHAKRTTKIGHGLSRGRLCALDKGRYLIGLLFMQAAQFVELRGDPQCPLLGLVEQGWHFQTPSILGLGPVFKDEAIGQESRGEVIDVPGRHAAGQGAFPPVPDHTGKAVAFCARICGGEAKTPGLREQFVDARRAAVVSDAKSPVAPLQTDHGEGSR